MNILVVDDDEATRNLLKEFLESNHYKVSLAKDAEQALLAVQSLNIEIILSDIRMEESSGLTLLKEIKVHYPNVVMILMTGFGSMVGAIEAIQKGAFDYISKPFDLGKLLALVQKAEQHAVSLTSKNKPTQDLMIGSDDHKTLLGSSSKMVEVYKTLAKATLSSSTVLIHGESGTGKELVARAIHENGDRKNKKFVAINCGALSENLLESELFGYKKGSFTGALSDKRGLFEESNDGTLFLDEIGDVSQGLQIKLLRVLQESEIRAVGSNDVKKINVRIIAATHRNLELLVTEKKFREDLYYRLKVIEIALPPLRERKEDIPELAQAFLLKASRKQNKKPISISKEVLQIFQAYSWPGNVRELEHQIERAVAMTSSSILTKDDFTLGSDSINAKQIADAPHHQESLESIEREHILKVLVQVEYNKTKASEILGIDRATLYRKAQKYGIFK